MKQRLPHLPAPTDALAAPAPAQFQRSARRARRFSGRYANLAHQSLLVGAKGAEATLRNALSELSEFGIKRPRAVALIQIVARAVDGWAGHFAQHGVCVADMAQLAGSIDRDFLELQRREFC